MPSASLLASSRGVHDQLLFNLLLSCMARQVMHELIPLLLQDPDDMVLLGSHG